MEHAVHAEPDADVPLGRLDVDVGGTVAHRLRHDRLHELDDRRFLERRLQLLVVALELFGGLRRKGFDLSVHAGELLDRLLDVGGGRDHRLDVAVRDRADVVQRVDVRGVRHRDQELAVAFPDRDRAVPARERVRQQHRGRRIDVIVGQVDEFQPDLLGQGADQVRLLDQPEVDQDTAEGLRGLAMLLERLLQLRSSDETLFDQDLSELLRLSLDRSHVGLPASVRSRSSGTNFVITALDLKQARELFGQHDRIDLGVGVELHRRRLVLTVAFVRIGGVRRRPFLPGRSRTSPCPPLRRRPSSPRRRSRWTRRHPPSRKPDPSAPAASPERPTPLATSAIASLVDAAALPSTAGGAVRAQCRAWALSGAGGVEVESPFVDCL